MDQDSLIPLGGGAYGEVIYMARCPNVALKQISAADITSALREIAMLKFMNHPYVIRAHNAQMDISGNCTIYMKRYSSSIAHGYLLKTCANMPPGYLFIAINRAFLCISRAVRYVHSCGFIHADIKPANILIDRENLNFVLCDFGISAPLIHSKMNKHVQTLNYRAPEVNTGGDSNTRLTASIDMWSIGCVFYELITTRQFARRKHILTENKEVLDSSAQIIARVFKVECAADMSDEYARRRLSELVNKNIKWKILSPNMPTELTSELTSIFSALIMKCLYIDPKRRINSNALADLVLSIAKTCRIGAESLRYELPHIQDKKADIPLFHSKSVKKISIPLSKKLFNHMISESDKLTTSILLDISARTKNYRRLEEAAALLEHKLIASEFIDIKTTTPKDYCKMRICILCINSMLLGYDDFSHILGKYTSNKMLRNIFIHLGGKFIF